jgi:hypothetical protein
VKRIHVIVRFVSVGVLVMGGSVAVSRGATSLCAEVVIARIPTNNAIGSIRRRSRVRIKKLLV